MTNIMAVATTSRQFETAYDNTFLEESTYDISNSARFRFYVTLNGAPF